MADSSATSGLLPEDVVGSHPDILLDSCRVCMARNITMQPIFEDHSNEVAQKVLYCTGVSFTQGDGYPAKMCYTCLQDLSVAHSFKSRCVQSEKAFQSIVPQSTLCVKTEPEDVDFDDHLCFYGDEAATDYDIKQDIDILKTEPNNISDRRKKVKNEPAKYMKKSMTESERKNTSTKREYQRKKKVKFKKIYCEACDIKFDNKQECQEHKKAMHNETEIFTCEFCGMTFSRIGAHERHLRHHLGLLPSHYRGVNVKSERSKSSVKQKVKMKFKKLYCAACDIKFDSKQESDEHKKTFHNEPKIYVCEFCGKSFTNMSTHYAHVRSHQPPQYKCEHCAYMSTNKHDLGKHLRIHSGVKPYQCESCPASYHTISNLKDHSRRMHQAVVKRFQCHLCEKQFYDRTKLNRHVDSHNDVKRFICPICHSSFTRRCYWKKHLEQKHNICLPRQRPGRQKHNEQMELDLLSRLLISNKLETSIDLHVEKAVEEKAAFA